MHRLFWKLFVTYWLALFVFSVGAVFSIGYYVEQVRAQHAAATPREDFRAHQQAAQAAAAAGVAGLAAWARGVDDRELVPWLVLGAGARDVLGRELSPGVLARLKRYQSLEYRERQDAGGTDLPPLRRDVVLPDGSRYWLVPDYQNVSLTRLLARPKVLVMPVALATLVGGILSLLLARYLAAPIERLRRATRFYAQGDFSQRVGPTLGRRRDEIVDLAYALDDMAERLDALLASQRDLLRDVSHKLRSPLARVQAALGLAWQSSQGAEAELARIEREIDRLNEMIGTILSVSRLESRVQPPLRETVDLAEILAEIAEDARVEGAALGVGVALEGETLAPFQGDPALIHSALENIVRNALRHSPQGGVVTVAVGRGRGAEGKDEYAIRVIDTGPGVPREMLEKIFDPFVRVDANRSGGGAGLGLAIARRAVLAHGGRLHAENMQQGGLCLTVRLPVP